MKEKKTGTTANRAKHHAYGFALWESGEPAPVFAGPALQGWKDAAKNYEAKRKKRIQEFDQRK